MKIFLYKYYYNMNNFFFIHLSLLLISIMICIFILKINNKSVEGFSQKEVFIQKDLVEDIYDKFYTLVYDNIFYSQIRTNFEIDIIINTNSNKNSKILDVGSGLGYLVVELNKKGYHSIGIDISKEMVKYANETVDKNNGSFIHGDALNDKLFNGQSFSHISCLYFTIYYIEDKEKFLKNCFKWLKRGGYFIFHLVDKDKFDPIVPPANPLLVASPQKYSKTRITKSHVDFKGFTYDSNFKMENGKVEFIETFEEAKEKKKKAKTKGLEKFLDADELDIPKEL